MNNNLPNPNTMFSRYAFVLALSLLLANDFYLKSQYSNWLTGKLSDFAGLYVFVQFVAVVFRVRVLWVAVISGFLFTLWKSDISSPFLDWWNSNLSVQIHRVVDPTDLIALSILPLSVRWCSANHFLRWNFLKYPVGALALLGIMATSTIPQRYNVNMDLQAKNTLSADQTYQDIDSILTFQGMKCVRCEVDQSYREYRDGDMLAYFNYDALSSVLYISLETYKPDLSTTKVDKLRAEVMSKLNSRFENITVRKESWSKSATEMPWREISLSFPKLGLPFTCYKDGTYDPEVIKALLLVDEFVSAKSSEMNSAPPYTLNCNVDSGRFCADGGMCRAIYGSSYRSVPDWEKHKPGN